MSENLNSCKFFVINAPSASCLNLACRWEHCVVNIKFIKSSMQKDKTFFSESLRANFETICVIYVIARRFLKKQRGKP